MSACCDVAISTPAGDLPARFAAPSSDAPAPGVIVIHDALGMTPDVDRHLEWLASEGYLALAPDLFHRGGRARCLWRAMRDIARGEGQSLDDVAAARRHLLAAPRASGKVGIMGFCLGGGYAFALAPSGDYDASCANYGGIAGDLWERLPRSCPVVASYGELDGSLKGDPERLRNVLDRAGVPHDIKVYEGVGHGFMNLHPDEETPWIFKFLGSTVHTKFDEAATLDARRRIASFFGEHLRVG